MSWTARDIVDTRAPSSIILIRILVGVVFLSEGLQKFIYPDRLGAGRFLRIGLPVPEWMGPIVGSTEALCGLLVLIGLFTRIAVIPLIGIMVGALLTTKLPILLGRELWGLSLRELPQYGPFSMLHESRTDLSMLISSIFLLIQGSGPLSLDARLPANRSPAAPPTTPGA